ncbi:cohesin domain-containing protein [Methanolobus mangrovi]|uniref:Cohesin domain-containing protein n=1 Tax=Methanolobus mangrovi TaxID=3072977 RepID=A0AA51YJZ6_9EURY|nr:cohesin domain-containing protein [Methanolobus mangrovi]WMW22669.1 cohesin domain-containing protein [Methanolobus mangrovi]
MTKITHKGMAGLTATLLIFCACFMVGVGLAAADPSVSVDPQTNEYDAGDTFQVTVMVNSDTDNLRAVNLQLDYDPAILSVNSVTDEDLLGAGALVAPGSGDDGAGTISYGIASTSGVYAPVAGTMLTIEFAIDASAANGTYNLDLNAVSLKDQDNVAIPGVIITDGTVKVGDEVIPTPSEPEVEISPVASGPVGPGDTFQVQVEVDSADYNLRAVNLQMNYDSSALMVNSITDEDLLGAGALVAPGSGDDGAGTIAYGIASTSGVYVPVAGTMLTIEFEVKAGAANGTYDLDLNSVSLKDQDNVAIPDVGVTDGSVQVSGDGQVPDMPTAMIVPTSSGPIAAGDTFQVDIEIDSADYNLRAVSVQLDYDPAALMVNSMTNGLLGPGALEAPGSGDDGAGTITYGLAATGGVYTPEAGTLLTIEFEVKADATDGIYDLDMYNVVLKDEANADIPGVIVTDGMVEVSTVPEVEGIALLPGWNLISIPQTLENAGIDYVLQDFNDTEVDSVFYYDASTGMMVVPDDFEPLKAYWVHNNLSETVVINGSYLTPMVPSTPPSLTLYPGWNAIGHTAMVELPAEVALSTIDDCYIKVMGPWMASTSEFAYVGYNGEEGVINGNQVGTDVFAMNMYEGYFVFVDEECLLG